jgi:hypothetical protein
VHARADERAFGELSDVDDVRPVVQEQTLLEVP